MMNGIPVTPPIRWADLPKGDSPVTFTGLAPLPEWMTKPPYGHWFSENAASRRRKMLETVRVISPPRASGTFRRLSQWWLDNRA